MAEITGKQLSHKPAINQPELISWLSVENFSAS